jgi:glycosyltransferase involved in cell wall biosynthesis
MRIFIASGIFHPEAGGPATYLYHLLPELVARGHTVTALSFGDGPSDSYPYPLTRIPRRNYLVRQWNYYRAAARLWPGHDLAYSHSLGLPLPANIRPRVGKIVGDQAWERAMNRGWVAPATDVDDFQTRRYGAVIEVNKLLRAREARGLDHVIVPSAYLKRMVTGWGVRPERVSVIYNALDSKSIGDKESQHEARRRLGLPAGPLLLTPARLTVWKGIDHSLRALAAIPAVRLVVAGDGPARSALERLAAELGMADRVSFAGRVAVEQMALYYRAADYTLLYSGYEGLSHVLVESLRSGTPAIASDKGGNPEVIENRLNGLLVPYVDVAALTETIRDAFSPGRRDQLASHSADKLERFEWDRMVSHTIEILTHTASGR